MPSNPELAEIVGEITAKYQGKAEALTDLLADIQQQLGYIPPSTVATISEQTGLSRQDIYRAIELSPSLQLKPTGKHTLYICNAENCCMQGGEELMAHAKAQLGIDAFQTTADDVFRLEPFQCLGNCSMSPNVMLDGRVHGMMDNSALDKLVDKIKQQEAQD